MKKILALLLAVVMVLGMVACASKTEAPAETTTTEPAAETTTEETKTEEPAKEEETATEEQPAEEGVIKKVALVTDVGTIDDESFNQATWQGVKAYCEANGIEYTYYQPTEDSTDARCISIDQAIKEGANVVVMPGYLFGGSIVREQEKYPEVYFIAVDVGAGDLTEDYATYYDPAKNVVCATFAEEQAGYLAGYAVVMDGYTKLGFLGGMAVPAVIRYGYGWLQGARDAAKELGVEVDVQLHLRRPVQSATLPSPQRWKAGTAMALRSSLPAAAVFMLPRWKRPTFTAQRSLALTSTSATSMPASSLPQ